MGRQSDRLRAANGRQRCRKSDEKPITSRVHLASAEPLELPPYRRAVTLERLAPLAVAPRSRLFGRTHDVREQERKFFARRQHAVDQVLDAPAQGLETEGNGQPRAVRQYSGTIARP